MAEPPDKNKKKKRPRRRVRPIAVPLIQIETEPPQPTEQSLRQWIEEGGPGLLFSMGTHAVVVIVMAWYTYRIISPSAIDSIDVGWTTVAARESKSLTPVHIEAFTASTEKTTRPKPQEGDRSGGKKDKPAEREPIRPVNVDNLLKDRTPRIALQRVTEHGGDERTMPTINMALGWLKRQQQSAGHWSLHEGYPNAGLSVIRTNTGATALALLPFLGAGHSPTDGEYAEVVASGITWLKGIQKADGNFHDHDELGRQTAFYAHAQATIAMCEAYVMSGDAKLQEPAERAIEFLLNSQQPVTGGWKYRPLDANSVADLSVTGWALMALHSARSAGIQVPDEAFQRATLFLESVSEENGSRYKYEPTDPPDRISVAMTAEGLLCRQFLGATRSDPALQNGIGFLTEELNKPSWSSGQRNVYEWYYVGHVLHNAGGPEFTNWYGETALAIVDNQTKSGTTRKGKDARGSWHPEKPIGSPHEYAQKAGRLYITSLSVLILELPFRYQSVYE